MYTLTQSGVTINGSYIPNDPGNRDWVEYQEWLAQGNTPAPMPAVPVLTIDEEYNGLSDWMKEVIKETGANITAFKAKVAARRIQP
jgi:hypothetical protein